MLNNTGKDLPTRKDIFVSIEDRVNLTSILPNDLDLIEDFLNLDVSKVSTNKQIGEMLVSITISASPNTRAREKLKPIDLAMPTSLFASRKNPLNDGKLEGSMTTGLGVAAGLGITQHPPRFTLEHVGLVDPDTLIHTTSEEVENIVKESVEEGIKLGLEFNPNVARGVNSNNNGSIKNPHNYPPLKEAFDGINQLQVNTNGYVIERSLPQAIKPLKVSGIFNLPAFDPSASYSKASINSTDAVLHNLKRYPNQLPIARYTTNAVPFVNLEQLLKGKAHYLACPDAKIILTPEELELIINTAITL